MAHFQTSPRIFEGALKGHGFSRAVTVAKSRAALAAEGSRRLRDAGAPLLSLFEKWALMDDQGSALLEFAICLPLLMVFVVGIYDFSGAFNQRQKIEQAAQEGAIIAGAQPMSDIASPTAPDSLLPVVTTIYNSLVGSGVLPAGTCTPPGTATGPVGVAWIYRISPCPDDLVITINRGWVAPPGPQQLAVGTTVTVQYPYHWRFSSVIQLLFPGSNSYAATTQVTESATVHNQM